MDKVIFTNFTTVLSLVHEEKVESKISFVNGKSNIGFDSLSESRLRKTFSQFEMYAWKKSI